MLDNSMLFRGDGMTPTVSDAWYGTVPVPATQRDEIAEDLWKKLESQKENSKLIIEPKELEHIDVPPSDHYFEGKYHGTYPIENFKHGIIPAPTTKLQESNLRKLEKTGIPLTVYDNIGGPEGYSNRIETLLKVLNDNQNYLFKSGGGIHIAPSKRGTFTAAATKHGKSVQAFASQVLANKENYSSAMVKKANFARNAAKWHGEGGILNRLESIYGGDREKMLSAVRSVLKNEYGLGGYKDDEPNFIGPAIPDVLKVRRDAVDDAVERVKAVENSKDNPNGGWDKEKQVWYPHDSPEGGAKTIAYGIKLSNGTPEAALAAEQGFLTDEQVDALTYSIVRRYHNNARKVYDKKYGAGEWDKLSAKQQSLLTDYEYNPGLRKFPAFMKAVRDNDKTGMLREYKRYLGKLELTGRNNYIKNDIEEMFSKK